MAIKEKNDGFLGGLGGKQDFIEMKDGKVAPFVGSSGGPVDAYGDLEKCETNSADMNAASAFTQRTLSKIDVMGTDAPTKSASSTGARSDNTGDHLTVSTTVEPYGTDAGKKASGQTTKRG